MQNAELLRLLLALAFGLALLTLMELGERLKRKTYRKRFHRH